MIKTHIFEGELFEEILIINGKEYEHIGFRSYNGGFEKLLNDTAEQKQLPKKAIITIQIHE